MVTQEERDWHRNEDRFRAEMDARSLKPALEKTVRHVVRKELLVEQIHCFQQLLRQAQTSTNELKKLPEAKLRHQIKLLMQQIASRLRPPNTTA